ncbi:MAG: YgiQ family radical SAM protein [Paludibacteraceae bacterium]|nr:YgiQ family radical SAM protein [Paludibacteraceae bacterium]
MPNPKNSAFLPTSQKEVAALGWDSIDIILFSGDAYVDHPAFGTAMIARVLQAEGFKVAVVPQPNWRDDLRDFKKLGRPNLFFGVTAGVMDSMVNHYTAGKRLRSNDAYTPEGKAGMRPDRATTVYSKILKQLYPDVPLVIGGIEASQRRLTHYDYWDDALHPSILIDTQADFLTYGMAERAMVDLAKGLQAQQSKEQLQSIPQIAFVTDQTNTPVDIELASHEACLASKKTQAQNFKLFEEESNRYASNNRLGQVVGKQKVIINPPYPIISTEQLDVLYDLPYTRKPHPRYKGKTIPAYEMIKYSITLHRGCFGGCSFCTISAHQGKFIASRSEASILREVELISQDDQFKGYISDLGGPSANMYSLQGKDLTLCQKCKKPACLHPGICKNLDTNHAPLIALYRKVRALPGIKKATIGSGIRYDLATPEYLKEVIQHHVSGRLKVAPEHTNSEVLNLMRKPSFDQFIAFEQTFRKYNQEAGLNQQLIPYFISSHPGCTALHMADLAITTKKMRFQLEQVQDFTPTPMTLSTEMYYTGYHPYTLQKITTAKTLNQKNEQRNFFFWYKAETKQAIVRYLKQIGRPDLITKIYPR